jgi:asparagine synthase (glutamine-hydrolysing)
VTEFAVLINWDGRHVEPRLLEAMNDCVRARCPDGSWVWADGPVGMAQSDLATLPEDEPGVPVRVGPLRIAASCRVDNRDEIRRALPADHAPPGGTDAALILAAYRAWGESCADRLIGDFAFAVWDDQRRHLFAARDFSGKCQLFYFQDRDRLYLVSDRAQALQDPTVPLEPDDEQIIEFLTPWSQIRCGWDQGLFRGFSAVPAGSVLHAEAGRVRVRRFWKWQDAPPRHRTKADVLEEYLETLREAVHCRLRSRTPVGIELSGGLDSSAVACLAAQLQNGSGPELHTLSELFDEDPEVDERVRIRPVLDRYSQLSPHFLSADRLFGPQCLEPDWSPAGLVAPFDIWMPPAGNHLYEVAIRAGCRTILTGQKGDCLNTGRDQVYFDLLRRGRWKELGRWLHADWKKGKGRTLRRIGVHGLFPLLAPRGLLRFGLLTWERWKKKNLYELPSFIPKAMARRIREMDRAVRIEHTKQFLVRCPVVRSTLVTSFPPSIGVMTKFPLPVDVRHPYMDRRLYEMVLSMPQELKWDFREQGGLRAGRLHHREALEGILPDEVRIENTGVGFGPAIRRSIPSDLIREWVFSEKCIHIFERGYVMPGPFLAAVDEHGGPSHSGDLTYLIAMLCLEGWLRGLATGGKIRGLFPPRGEGPAARWSSNGHSERTSPDDCHPREVALGEGQPL